MICEPSCHHIHVSSRPIPVQIAHALGASPIIDRRELYDTRSEYRDGTISFYCHTNLGGDWNPSGDCKKGKDGWRLERSGSNDGFVWRVCGLQQCFPQESSRSPG